MIRAMEYEEAFKKQMAVIEAMVEKTMADEGRELRPLFSHLHERMA